MYTPERGKSEGTVTGTLKFYPKWTGTAYKYTVKFASGAEGTTGKMADQTGLVYDEPAALKENTFTRPGYTFAGWNTKANGTGKSYDDGAMVEKLTAANNGTVTLYAQWTKN